MPHVFVAGATGYLGRHIVSEYLSRGWTVTALVRDASRATNLGPARLVEGQATKPDTLTHLMQGVDLVISSLGITRQTDGVGYWDVDYQANLNLLNEAIRSDVARFA
jgi:nucleoside-diphosphate-sugar epimerase